MKNNKILLILMIIIFITITACEKNNNQVDSSSSDYTEFQSPIVFSPEFKELNLQFTVQGFNGIHMLANDSIIYFDSPYIPELQTTANPTYYQYNLKSDENVKIGSLQSLGYFTWSYALFNNKEFYYAPAIFAQEGENEEDASSSTLVKLDLLNKNVSVLRNIVKENIINQKILKIDDKRILILVNSMDEKIFSYGVVYNIKTQECNELFNAEQTDNDRCFYSSAAISNNKLYVQKCRLYDSDQYLLAKQNLIEIFSLDGTLEKTIEIPNEKSTIFDRIYVWNDYVFLQPLQNDRISNVIWKLNDSELEPVVSVDRDSNYLMVIDSNQEPISDFPYVFFKNYHFKSDIVTDIDIVAFNIENGESKSFKFDTAPFNIKPYQYDETKDFGEYIVDNKGNFIIQYREYAKDEEDFSKYTTRHFYIDHKEIIKNIGL